MLNLNVNFSLGSLESFELIIIVIMAFVFGVFAAAVYFMTKLYDLEIANHKQKLEILRLKCEVRSDSVNPLKTAAADQGKTAEDAKPELSRAGDAGLMASKVETGGEPAQKDVTASGSAVESGGKTLQADSGKAAEAVGLAGRNGKDGAGRSSNGNLKDEKASAVKNVRRPYSVKMNDNAKKTRKYFDQKELELELEEFRKYYHGRNISVEEFLFVRRVRNYIMKNIADEKLNVESIATEMVIGAATLYRRIKLVEGVGTKEFITRLRLEHAMKLMREKRCSASEAAYGSGFSTLSSFDKMFKRYEGVTPGAYVRMIKKNKVSPTPGAEGGA